MHKWVRPCCKLTIVRGTNQFCRDSCNGLQARTRGSQGVDRGSEAAHARGASPGIRQTQQAGDRAIQRGQTSAFEFGKSTLMRTKASGESTLLLVDAVELLRAAQIDYAIIGAMAASVHGVIRASRDADALLSITVAALPDLERRFAATGFS